MTVKNRSTFCLTDPVSVPGGMHSKKRALIVHAIIGHHAICHFPSDTYHHHFIFTYILLHIYH